MFQEFIEKYSAMFGVPQEWVYGVIQAESSGNPNAFNPNDPSYGLMGLTLPAARDMGYTGTSQGLFDPETNIKFGTKYLAWISQRWDTVNPAEIYSAYNSGRPKLYLSSSEVASNVERFLRFMAEWSPVAVVVGGGASIGLLLALLILARRRKS